MAWNEAADQLLLVSVIAWPAWRLCFYTDNSAPASELLSSFCLCGGVRFDTLCMNAS